ncbi:YidB family protein [Streptomyces sp. NBC_01353]|uniref:YidB family protein n=1 Tax=Streptomyces sp. NBC_01353 TaxID=2903835 RepID=UPI002E31C5D4|nr:YidB family protein [Streptomyces sp. NBC_01353]
MAGNDLGSLLGGLLGGGGTGQSAGGGNILGSLLGALMAGKGGTDGGNPPPASGRGDPHLASLGGLMDMLTRSGLVDQAQSWVGTGQNQPVSGPEIAQALPDETLQKVAQDAGVSPQEAADEIAKSLPQVVDKLTPSGSLPHSGESLEDLIRQQRF